ncbi:hypothetical protein ACU4GD_18150 [Cupriavidus basilensis]
MGLTNAGGDTIGAVKQAAEFGVTAGAARSWRACSSSAATSRRWPQGRPGPVARARPGTGT